MVLKESLREEPPVKQPSFFVRHGLWSNSLILALAITSIWLLLCLYYTQDPLPYLYSLFVHLFAYLFLLVHMWIRRCVYHTHWSMNLWPSIPIGLCNFVLLGFGIQYSCGSQLINCHDLHAHAVDISGWWLWLTPIFVIVYLVVVALTPDILSLLSSASWSYNGIIQEFQDKSNERPEIVITGKAFHTVRTGGGDTDNSNQERVQTDCETESFLYEDFRCLGPTLDLSEVNYWKLPSLFQIVFDTEPSGDTRRALENAIDDMRQRMLLKDQESEASMIATRTEINRLVWPSSESISGYLLIFLLRFCVILSTLTGTAFIFLCMLSPFFNVVVLHYVKEVTLCTEFFEKMPIIVYRKEQEEEDKDQVPLLSLTSVLRESTTMKTEGSDTEESVVLESDSSNGSPPRHDSILSESPPRHSLSPSVVEHSSPSSPFESPTRVEEN